MTKAAGVYVNSLLQDVSIRKLTVHEGTAQGGYVLVCLAESNDTATLTVAFDVRCARQGRTLQERQPCMQQAYMEERPISRCFESLQNQNRV